MIKNVLYSLFIHFVLLSVIYFALVKKNKKEIEADQEVLVSAVSLDSNSVPPINEIIKKTDPEVKKPKPEKEEPKPEVKNKEEKTEKKIDKKPEEKKPEEKAPKLAKKTPIPAVNQVKNPTPNQNPVAEKIAPTPTKQPVAEPPSPSNPSPDTSKTKPEDSKADPKESNDDQEFFKVLNLKAFKNVNDDQQASNLSARETINIQSQLKMCYKRAIEESGFESKTKIIIRIQISREGYIENDLDEMVDIEKYNNPAHKDYKIIVDNIKRALDLCSPLRNLPAEKYESWKEIVLQFDVGNNGKK